ncbi:MAG: protein-L-isoaspartate(D-aspartate) O-methyltransferase [Campylobacterales bacterium]|nr:protein-L-isoaspartate(D-aspartate) O-methyltransferase [Campylobacterales bacterium]
MTTLLNQTKKTKSHTLADKIADKVRLSPAVYKAFCDVVREDFVPAGFERYAYELDALPISGNQFISSPLTVAKMTMALEAERVDSVLEIGCGSGYQAAILSKLFRRVFTIERIEKLYVEARKTFKDSTIHNVSVKFDDGQKGWDVYAPFDRIIFSASAKFIPESIFKQLEEGGVLVAPMEKDGKQVITRFRKKGGQITEEEIDQCLFVPVLDGVQK